MNKFLLLIFSTFLFLYAEAASNPQISISPYTQVDHKKGGELTLGEVAQFKGIDKNLKRKLSQIKLSHRPVEGERVTLPGRSISQVLRAQKSLLEEHKVKNLHIKIPQKIIVEKSLQEITRLNLSRHILHAWKQSCPQCKFEMKHLSTPVLPQGLRRQPWEIVIPQELPKGSFSYPIHIVSQGTEKPHVFWASGTAGVYRKVPVLSRAVNIGHRLQKHDIAFKYRDVSFAHDSNPSLDQLIGQKVSQGMRAGEILFHRSIVREKALRRGEIVKMVTGHGDFEISTRGVSQQDAYVGDVVSVKNPQTNKVVTGKVVSAGEVHIQ